MGLAPTTSTTLMLALAVTSIVCTLVEVALKALPTGSVPETVTSKLLSAARSEPATATLKVLPTLTIPL